MQAHFGRVVVSIRKFRVSRFEKRPLPYGMFIATRSRVFPY